jgi:16S rRNA (cytosine967-C5)-methyltransferase
MQLTQAGAIVIQKVVDHGRSLDQALMEAPSQFEGSLPALKELCFGGCRFYFYYDAIISGLVSKPLKQKDRLIHFLIISAFYQLDCMSVPDHAVVNETVKALKKSKQDWARNFVNGVLRNYLRNREEIAGKLMDNPSTEYSFYSFPSHLYELIRSDWPEYYRSILDASNEKPPLTIRVNTSRVTREAYMNILSQQGTGFCSTVDSEIGITFEKPVGVREVPGFDKGEASVQDESAQLVARGLDMEAGMRVLDGCAAPGGKTCLLLESEPGLDELVAVDLPERVEGIRENLQRIGLTAAIVESDFVDTEAWWDGAFFDRILMDVPCSGSGVMRRHPDIRHRRQAGDIAKFHRQQLILLDTAWKMLKPGGVLLYVTCSIFNQENDLTVEKFLGRITDFELQSLEPVFGLETRYGRQRLPGVHSGDGFYYCKLRRTPKETT